MITIDKENRQIVFQNEYSEDEAPKPIYRNDLITCYICPKCEEIIIAYFKTDVYIKVWEYDESADNKNPNNSESDLRHYKYRVFFTKGAMGIENKEHNTQYQPKCNFRYFEALNLLYGINGIVNLLNKQFDKEIFKPIAQIKDKATLLSNLSASPHFELVQDICSRGDPLIHLNIMGIDFEETEYWKYEGKEYEKKNKQEQKNKLEAFKSVHSLLQC